MINLKELEKRLEEQLDKETKESLMDYINNKRYKEMNTSTIVVDLKDISGIKELMEGMKNQVLEAKEKIDRLNK